MVIQHSLHHLLTPIDLGHAQWPARLALAPMSGVSDLVFRRLALRFGAPVVVSEMVVGRELLCGSQEARLRMEGEGITPHIVQIAGRDAASMAEGARMAEASGADIIDINMGCPAKKVTSGYSGSALMRDLDHATAIIKAIVAAVHVPVTLKMRLGWDHASLNAPELARRAEQEGIRLLSVHGRTRCQFYHGSADWRAIAHVVAATSLPLIANGDLASLSDLATCLQQSKSQGVMIGRATYGRPWLVGAMARAIADSKDGQPAMIQEPDVMSVIDLMQEHHAMMLEHYGHDIGLRTARKHLGWYCDGLAQRLHACSDITPIKIALQKADTLDDVHDLLSRLRERLSDVPETVAGSVCPETSEYAA